MKNNDFYIVGIGASAGGSEAIERLFSNIPADVNAAFIVIQHISQEHKGLSRDLLAKRTSLNVQDAEDKKLVEPGNVYFTPAHKTLFVRDGSFSLQDKSSADDVYQPIDTMLTSLGKNNHSRTIAIILSGTGTDGSRGIRFIKENNGLVMTQQPDTAQFNGMPLMAISSGYTDYILPPEDMGPKLTAYIKNPKLKEPEKKLDLKEEDKALEQIIELVSDFSNVDFHNYKINSLVRRIEKRMLATELDSLAEYLQYLQKNSGELMVLYASLMIGVTSFFRDPPAFEALEKDVIPEICKGKKDYETIRIWVAGCSHGEEAFSIAMLFEEYIKKEGLNLDYKIFATDLDAKAVEFAGINKYTSAIEEEVSPERLQNFFVKNGDFYDVRKSIRKKIIFVRHNILKDPPFIRLDLITCRNLFIYLKGETQKKLLWDFHYSLNTQGFLFLGHNESLEESEKTFKKYNAKWKIYRNTAHNHRRPVAHRDYTPSYSREIQQPPSTMPLHEFSQTENYADMLAERYAPACIIINEANDVVYVNGSIEKYLHIPKKRTSLNVFKMINNDLALIFRNGIRKVKKDQPDVYFKNVTFQNGDEEIVATIYFRKLKPSPELRRRNTHQENTVLIEFHDVNAKPAKEKPTALVTTDQFSKEHIEELERDLELTKKELQYTVQEIETVNEELQASNEEMTSANEELQSTNEELQSSNEELFSVNLELKNKVDELTVLNNDINNLFRSSDLAIIFLDEKLGIRKFTPAVEDHLNIRETDIGRPISDLSTNLNFNEISDVAQKVLQNLNPFEKKVKNNNGRSYIMRVLPYKTEEMQIKGVVITFVDITELRQQTIEISSKNRKLQKVNQYLDDFVYTVAHDLRAPLANMLGFMDLIKSAENKDEKDQYIRHLDSMVHRMDNILRGLVDIIDAQNNVEQLVKQVNLPETFTKIRNEFIEHLEKENVEIKTDFKVEEIRYIEPYIMSIFRNLLSNSIKYRVPERNLKILVRTETVDGCILLTFKDNGTGIDLKEHSPQLFKPFKRFNNQKEGKGIGLHLIKTIVEKNNGEVSLESAVNKGTEFQLKLKEYKQKKNEPEQIIID